MEWVGNWKEVQLAREPSGSTTRAAEDVTTTEQPAQLLIWQPKTALWLWQQRMTVTMINNYLLKITSDGITKLKDSFKDPYGNIFKKGQFVLQGKFFLREIDQAYKVDEKAAAVLPGTVHYICGALTSKGKRRQIFQVPLNEYKQILASL